MSSTAHKDIFGRSGFRYVENMVLNWKWKWRPLMLFPKIVFSLWVSNIFILGSLKVDINENMNDLMGVKNVCKLVLQNGSSKMDPQKCIQVGRVFI